jgi:cell wall-associated NlpC family hydrolase
MQISGSLILAILFLSCSNSDRDRGPAEFNKHLKYSNIQDVKTAISSQSQPITQINTKSTTPTELVAFAMSLKGTPYKYGSTNPDEGFDCSGFITYVFNHFKIGVPRSSVDFAGVNHEVTLKQAKTGDLILFTGTDSTVKVIGHMGILIIQSGQPFSFIHSTSGKAYGVTETPLNAYYMGRYMKTIRVFPQNDN